MKIILLTLLILVVFKIEATNYTLKISTITNDSILIENFNTQNQPTEPEIVDPIYHESRVHDVMTQLSNSLYWSEDYPDALGALTNGIPSYSQLNCVNFFADGSFMEVNINKSCKISFYTINIFYQDGIILKNQSNQTLFTYNFGTANTWYTNTNYLPAGNYKLVPTGNNLVCDIKVICDE